MRKSRAMVHVWMDLGRLCVFVVSLSIGALPLLGKEKPLLDLGSRRELMLDDHLFETVRNLAFHRHSPRDAEKILDLDAPWEGRK